MSKHLDFILIFVSDTNNMLRMLRVSKFSQLRARSLVDNLYTLIDEVPNWFKNIDLADPNINRFYDFP